MSRRAPLILGLALAALGALAADQGHEPPPPDLPPPPTAEEVRRIADHLRAHGNEDLARQLLAKEQLFPEGPPDDAGERWRHRRGGEGSVGFGSPDDKMPSASPFDAFARMRTVHEELLRLERMRLKGGAAPFRGLGREQPPREEDGAVPRVSQSYADVLGDWVTESRNQLPVAKERVRLAIDAIDQRQTERPILKALGKEMRTSLVDLEAWLAAPPENDQAFADGLREKLGNVVRGLPQLQPSAGMIPDERHAARLQREIDLLRGRLDMLEQELRGVRERVQSPVPMEEPGPQQERRRRLPPLPEDSAEAPR